MHTAFALLTGFAHFIGWVVVGVVVGVLSLGVGGFLLFWVTDRIGLTKMFDD